MGSDARTHPAPRARAVAGAPVDGLLARADELARRWAIGLILALPLERIGELPLERFVRAAPALCAQVVRALESDEELARITARVANGSGHTSPVSRIAEITGARDGTAAVEAVEALRGVLWEALQEELCWAGFEPSPSRLLGDLADRLAYVCSSALVSSLTQSPSAGEPAGVAPAAPTLTVSEPAAPAREPALAASQRSPLGNGVVIVDEGEPPPRRAPAAGALARREPEPEGSVGPAPPFSAGAGARRARPRAHPWDTPLRAARADAPEEAG